MFTKLEVRKMKKGFHPSRSGRSETAIVGKVGMTGNRKERRSELNTWGEINFQGKPKMQVIGTSRFLHFVQIVPEFEIEGTDSGEKMKVQTGVKKINHSILLK